MVPSSYASVGCLGLAGYRTYSRTDAPSESGTKCETVGVESGVGLHAKCTDLSSDNQQPSVIGIYAIRRISSQIQICTSICLPLDRCPFLVLDRKHAR